MVRTQIQLTETQAKRLKRLAHAQNRSMAELIREGVDLILAQLEQPTDSRTDLVNRMLSAIGKFHSGLPDLGTNHDAYLDDAYDYFHPKRIADSDTNRQ